MMITKIEKHAGKIDRPISNIFKKKLIIDQIEMVTYNYDTNGVNLLNEAANYFEGDMGDFESRKELLSQRTMAINTHDVKDKVCAIKDRIPNCVLEGNDVVAAKVILEHYKSGITRTIALKKQISAWTLDIQHLEQKLPQVEAEIQKVLALFGPPDFDMDISRE